MSSEFRIEDLVDRLLLIETLNSTLIHFILSSQVSGNVDPDRVDSLTQGLKRTRKWIEETLTNEATPSSTANILSLIVKRMAQLESILPKLSQKAKDVETQSTAAEILSLLEGSTPAKTAPAAGAEPTTTAAPLPGERAAGLVPLLPDEHAEEEAREPFKRVDMEDDEWGLISQANRLIQQYSRRCHVLLPTFWFEVMREIHRYQSDSPYIGDVIQVPSEFLTRIIKGLLTEAPGARLLQDLMKHRPQEKQLSPSETERIERAVARYFTGLENLLKGEDLRVQDKISEAQTAFDGFGWGGPELEKRIIKRINQRCQEALQNAESDSDDHRKVIYAEVTKLLCKLQHAMLAEPRLREILALMKP
ncbi:MAG: hypothetical protein K9W43_12220 [Candidatus Thorarchaeota archaeon]|nr:hypothetical protein [Candidatus Thorarchaeota archaeon]